MDPLTQAVVDAVQRMDTGAGGAAIEVGRRAHAVIRKRLQGITEAGPRKTTRAEVVESLRAAVQGAGYRAGAADLNRYVGMYHVGQCFGVKQAKGLPRKTLKALCPLVQRNRKMETWQPRAKTRAAGQAVFDRAVAGELQPDQVAAAVNLLLGRSPRARSKIPKPTAIERTITMVGKLDIEHQRKLYQVLRKKFGQAAEQPPAAPRPSIPIPDAPVVGRAAEVKEAGKPGIFGRRRAG